MPGGSARRAPSRDAAATVPPRWADFSDPLDAIGARFRERKGAESARTASRCRARIGELEGAGARDRRRPQGAAHALFGAGPQAIIPTATAATAAMEKALQKVIAAYQQLKSSPAFA